MGVKFSRTKGFRGTLLVFPLGMHNYNSVGTNGYSHRLCRDPFDSTVVECTHPYDRDAQRCTHTTPMDGLAITETRKALNRAQGL